MIGRVLRIGACSTSLRVYPPTNIPFDAGRLHGASLPRWEGRDLGGGNGNPRSAPGQCRELAGPAREAERWPPKRGATEAFLKSIAVLVITYDILTPVAPGHELVDRPTVLEA